MSDAPRTTTQRRPLDPEAAHALRLANKVLDDASRDPDDDLSVLARRMLREREIAGVWLDAAADARAERDRLRGALLGLGFAAKDAGDIFRLRPDMLVLCGPAEHAALKKLAAMLDLARTALGGDDG